VDTAVNKDKEEASETIVAWVQCEDCNKWFTLPQGITTDDLPDVFVCGLRWWDCSLQKIKTGYKDDWCRKGAIKTNLVTKWLRQLATRAAESMEPIDPVESSVDLVPESIDGLLAGSGSEITNHLLPGITNEPIPQENFVTTEPQDYYLVNPTPRLEGSARTRTKDCPMCANTRYTLHNGTLRM
jgi:hypothetical protein